jgi:UDP-N-acetylmuramoyl-tripeptide--D-alanyl-D-alanine ligase
LEIQNLYKKFLECSGISINTRTLKVDDLFVAIKGANFDGNKYALKAIDAGAKYALVDDPSLATNNQLILVEDCLATLQELANHHRKQFTGSVLAITGSNGKTTTKELVYQVLKTHLKVQCTQGNFNNHLGVPLTLLNIEKDVDVAIIEMGANHLGEIAALCQIAEPTYGIITNIGTAHIGEFGGRENIIRAKSELFDYLLKNNGLVFINKEDVVLNNMSKRFKKHISFPNDLCIFKNSTPYVKYKDQNSDLVKTNLIGSYNFLNIASAITIGNYFRVPNHKIHEAIKSFIPDNNRSQILKLGSNTVILDAYNANPDSVKVALNNLADFDSASKVAVLGDMKELGIFSEDEHKKIIDHSEGLNLKDTFFVGEEYSKINSTAYQSIDKLEAFLIQNSFYDSVVLLKGSRSMALEQLTEIEEIWK